MPKNASDNKIEQLYREFGVTAFRVCLFYLGNRHDAEDALQAVFEKACTRCPVSADDERCKAWLITCARNVCRNMAKRASRNVPWDEAMLDGLQDDSLEKGEQARSALRAIMGLPPAMRVCTYLHYVEGYTSPEIAKMLRLSASTVRSNYGTGIVRVRAALEGEL